MRLITRAVAIAAAAMLLTVAAPVEAAAAKPAPAPSNISLNGGPVSYGDTVSFTTTVGIKPSKFTFVYIGVTCFQGEAQVFGELGYLDGGFLLVDGPQAVWDGGAASCTAQLISRVANNTRVSYETLATTTFDVSPA